MWPGWPGVEMMRLPVLGGCDDGWAGRWAGEAWAGEAGVAVWTGGGAGGWAGEGGVGTISGGAAASEGTPETASC